MCYQNIIATNPTITKNKLANWLRRQRDEHKKQKLSEEKFKLLDSIGIVWDTDKQGRDLWNSKYNKLIEFRKTNPDRWPNSNSKDKEERALGRWCLSNRQWGKENLKKFGFGDYPKERKQKLDIIGFVWAHGIKWEDNFIKLKRNINPYYLPSINEDRHFYYWLFNQYQYYNNKILSDEKIEKLKQIGFEEWHLLRNKRSSKKYREDKWEENYNKLRKYIDEDQNKLPSYNTDEFIYQWIFRQNYKYHRGELSEYQISKLNQIGMKDWLNHDYIPSERSYKNSIKRDHRWNTQYNELKDYIIINKKLPSVKENKKLNKWIYKQKNRYNKGKLSQEELIY